MPPLIVCEHCDAVYQRRTLARGESARCQRCHAVLYRAPWLSVHAMLALTVTAMLCFVMANSWPIVALGLNGKDNASTLWGAIIAVWGAGVPLIAVLAALTLFFFPLAQILLFTWVLMFLRFHRRPPAFAPAMRAIRLLRPWAMIEVFMLGTLVALTKVSSLFDLEMRPGVILFAGLTVTLTLVTTFDVRDLWTLKQERCR
ncbi:paraquat-inducible protein A [Oleiagrimonas sp. C23AA]|nr:paraquat-inducible protein A [Oleiagrimonas sp. C23AA]